MTRGRSRHPHHELACVWLLRDLHTLYGLHGTPVSPLRLPGGAELSIQQPSQRRRARTALLSDADDSCWYALMLDVAWQTNTSRRGSSNCYWLEEHCHGESPSWIVSLPALLFTSLWTCTALPTVVDVQLYAVSV